ncbi:MAG: hypothetical protein C4562_00560 [Actinobacteria bacterium]|nr:MAG: hypothetical protein C4562_00560 [Actinomycetota bacterium]
MEKGVKKVTQHLECKINHSDSSFGRKLRLQKIKRSIYSGTYYIKADVIAKSIVREATGQASQLEPN